MKKGGIMYKVWMVVDGEDWLYGTYSDCFKANEVALWVRDTRSVDVWVEEVEEA